MVASSSLNLPRTTVRRLAAKDNVFVGKIKTNADEADTLMERSKTTRGKVTGLKLLAKFQDMHEARQWLVYQDLIRKLLGSSFGRRLGTALHGRWWRQMSDAIDTSRVLPPPGCSESDCALRFPSSCEP